MLRAAAFLVMSHRGMRHLSSSRLADGMEIVPLSVSVGNLTLKVWEVANADDALRAAIADDTDPYGAVCWPSAMCAAQTMCDLGDLNGVDVLELGAGTGLTSHCATALGARVTATDASPIALKLLEHSGFNVARLDVFDVDAVLDAVHRLEGQRILIVASDMLYERPLARALARALNAVLATRANVAAIVCDPGRHDGRRAFAETLDLDAVFTNVPVDTSAIPLGRGGKNDGALTTIGRCGLRFSDVFPSPS